MEKEIRILSDATGKLLGAFARSLKEFEADTRQSRKELFQELLRKGAACCGQRRSDSSSEKTKAGAGG